MKNNELHKKIPKWGFGMAPLKASTESQYRHAIHHFIEFLLGKIPAQNLSPDTVSEIKGLVNRCLRQDQWDWFTVYSLFGEPLFTDFRYVSSILPQLRRALCDSNWIDTERFRQQIINSYFLTNCLHFLGKNLSSEQNNDTGGYIYILSIRSQNKILKIGMTTRSVIKRVKEINSATGVLIPFSVRRIFRVSDATKAEQEIFKVLSNYRVRPDREFFQLDFKDAVKIIEDYLKKESLLFQLHGTVKWFSIEKQYGFITDKDGNDIFFHISAIAPETLVYLNNGSYVQFELGYRPQGWCARNVCIIQKT